MNRYRTPYYKRQRRVPRNKDPLTTAEAAWLIACSPATIINQIKSREIPARRVRGRFVIKARDFWRWFHKPRRQVIEYLGQGPVEEAES
jgi:excisionase family DNA binding protein